MPTHVHLVRRDLGAVDDAELVSADAELHLGTRRRAGGPADVAGEGHARIGIDLQAGQRQRARRGAAAGAGRAAAPPRRSRPRPRRPRLRRPHRRVPVAPPRPCAGAARAGAAAGSCGCRRRCRRSSRAARARRAVRARADVAPPVPAVADAPPVLPAAPVSTPAPSLLTQPAATAKSAGASNRRIAGERGDIVSTVTSATRIGSPVDPDHQIGVVIAKVVMNAAGSER